MLNQNVWRRAWLRIAVIGGVFVALAMAFVPAAIESSTKNGLEASVQSSTRGSLAIGDTVWNFIYVSNGNELTSATDGQFAARETLHNAFVVNSVEQRIFVDGAEYSSDTFYPAPNEYPRTWAGHWPATLRCPSSGACTLIGSPAVVPGEQAAVLFAGWGHGPGEPNGKYVFVYTVHGTLNGTPVDVTASSRSIFMTD